MSFLLFPEEERTFIERVLEKHSGVILKKDYLVDGSLKTVDIHDLDFADFPNDIQSTQTIILWLQDCGDIKTMKDAPQPHLAKDKVATLLTKEAAGALYENIIDYSRTPIIRWRRSRYHSENRLIPALLQSMPVPLGAIPAPLRKSYNSLNRWLKSEAVKVNPFEFCSDINSPAPNNLNQFWVWAHPEAFSWLQSGGEVWPWSS